MIQGPGTAVTRSRRRGIVTGPSGFLAVMIMMLISVVVFPVLATITLLTRGPKAAVGVARGMIDNQRNALAKATKQKS